MGTQPNLGLRRFSSMIAAMSSAEGPLGPGLRREEGEEKSRRYLRLTNALWNLNSVARLDKRAEFWNPAGTHEQRGQRDQEAIERSQIRRSLPASITDKKLMFQ
jgi:hypothetical protein